MTDEVTEQPEDVVSTIQEKFYTIRDQLAHMDETKAEVDRLKAEQSRLRTQFTQIQTALADNKAAIKEKLELLQSRVSLARKKEVLGAWLAEHDDFGDDDDLDWGDDDEQPQDPEADLPDEDPDPQDGTTRAPTSPNTRKLEAAVANAPGGPDTKGWVFRVSLSARKQADDVAKALTNVAVRKKPVKGPAKLYALKAPLMGDVTRPTPSVLHVQSSSSSLDTLKEIVAALPKLLSGVKYTIQDARIMPAECPDCKSSRFLIKDPEFCRRHITPTPGCQAFVQQAPPKKRKR